MMFLYVAIGGFFGAIARYGVSQLIKQNTSNFPFATFFVNTVGSFLLGIIIGSVFPSSMRLFFGVGFLGSFTTYSTLIVENVKLILEGKYKIMFLYSFLSYIIGFALAFLGLIIGISLEK
ncbi:fluoride efflux transporter FluC [Lederbergia citri]|uniref:Fluoride-specific ion channel FluC n=1 Tax=Lederbergia citri TaxID=2833580 RepID=A0A942TA97_9BACI|nr:CrcB family protein [Lederbergia citri]MBS4194096.1 CrcB family protein [Lederbergia citri]